MASIIKIKRSALNGDPSVLAAGELAYSDLPGDETNGGDRLYIGTGTETNGNAANHAVIGGKYFTDKLDHTPGTLTADSALIVDANSKLDRLLVDNIEINGNAISTTNTNGDLTLSPNGTGQVSISGNYKLPNLDGTAGQALVTDGAGSVTFQTLSSSGSGSNDGFFYKADPSSVVFVKTSAITVSIKAGTKVWLPDGSVKVFNTDTAVSMPTLTQGEDYSIWVLPDGTAQAVADPFSSPAAPPATNARKIGGFHYGLVEPGTTPASGGFSTSGFTNIGGRMIWTQADVDRIAGINEYSLWDLRYHAKGEQHGMALDPQAGVWFAIYFCSTDHITNGISRYNTNVASGSVLPKIPLAYGGDGTMTYGRLSYFEANEIVLSHGCRFPSYDEFSSAAFGVNEGQSLGGPNETIPATTRQPGFTSRIGLEQVTGHQYVFGHNTRGNGGNTWFQDPNRGQSYGYPYTPILGGTRYSGAVSGSRCASWNAYGWYSSWILSIRAVSEHVIL